MRYWVTTHWPTTTDYPNAIDKDIWLPVGRESVGERVQPGDYVAVYESKSGRNILKTYADKSVKSIPRIQGKEGIILYGEVLSKISAFPDSSREFYSDGTDIWWKWYAPVKVLSQSGFLSRLDLCNILGYSENYNLRGFGEDHSGLKEISHVQFNQIKKIFLDHNPIELPQFKSPHSFIGHGKGGESQAHKELKHYVSSNPELVLGERGLITLREEYPFGTGDRADIVLYDEHNRIIGLEVELFVDESDNSGPIQAIKYRRMLEYITDRNPGDSRSILVAYHISQEVKKRCKKYGIETHEILKDDVCKWKSNN